MTTCANCSQAALYTYKVSSDYSIHYCQYHLPKFLTAQKNAGLLTLEAPAPVVDEAPSEAPAPKKKSTKTVDPEPVAEPVADPAPEQPVEPAAEEPAVSDAPTDATNS